MKKIKIGNKLVGDGEPCLISLEPGATHEGLESAKALLKAVAESSADAVKFQTFLPGDADRIMGRKDILIEFGTPEGKMAESVYGALKRREMSKDEWIELVSFAKEADLAFITAPYFLETVDFLLETGVDAIKVSKGDINNSMLIDYIAKTGLPVILDGRERFEDVDKAVETCEKNGNRQIIIMHCPSGYPAPNAGVHLRAIEAMKKIYSYPVGFADHSIGGLMNYAAVALGANMLEKTITLDRTAKKVEHFMSLDPNDLKEFVKNVRAVEEAMGDPRVIFKSRVEENARRSFVAKRDIKKGEVISSELLDFKRPGNSGISCSALDKVLGRKAKTSIPKDAFLKWEMLD
ncbi:MAG: N-acetylneuraminate synthase family protein [Candidatus Nealsonbacteria bacterium]|nr:N-acetylneuraminate synthase family protein [Candidatus Nealsonbacteria bacterium]